MSDITVTLGAKDEGLSSSLSGIRSQAAETSKGFDLSFGKIAGAAAIAGAAVKVGMLAIEAATAGARAVVDGFGDAIDLGGKLNDLSSRTGESAGNLLVLQRAFENTGVGADKVGTSVNKLQKFMTDAAAGGAEQGATLDALGVSMSDLAGKTPTEQMGVLAGKIASISDPAERARASMEVFGKSGGELLPLLNNFGAEIEGAKGQLGDMPNVMDRSAGALDSLGDNLSAMGSKTMEFAAGFIESALPALNSFTSALSGVDAAGWGAALMKQVMSVADFLIGAFKAPMPAIEAIGLGLLAGVKIAGNNYLNSLIDAGKFASAFFSTSLPGIIAGVLGNTIIKVFIDGCKAFIDAIRGVITAFETWLGAAIKNVVEFFTTKFSAVLNAVAQDFKAAMTDPIGFVSGKLDSALKGVMENGGSTFQTSFDKAGGSSLDKISAGLGAVSAEYGEKIVGGATAAKDEFGKLITSLEASDKDFFGAKETATAAANKFGEVKDAGTKLREDFEASAKAAEDAKGNTKGAAGDAESVATSFSKAEGSAKKMKEELSASAKLLEDVTKSEAKDAVDKGGKLAKKAADQMAAGNFSGARRTAGQIANNEAEVNLRGIGANKDRRALADIGKDYGLSAKLGEDSNAFRERVRRAREEGDYGQPKQRRIGEGKPSIDKPGKDGSASGKTASDSKAKTLDSIVQSILDLVEKIEPKLPVAALAA